MRRLGQWCRYHPLGAVGAVSLVIVVLLVAFGPVLLPYGANQDDMLNVSKPPSAAHWLGTDQLGRDQLVRTLVGGRVSLLVGLGATAITLVIGVTLGALAGFLSGRTDWFIMRLTDVAMTFPSIVIILVVTSVAGPSLRNTVLVIGALGWPTICRLVRARMLSLRERDFVLAVRSLGATEAWILIRHGLPHVVEVVVVYATVFIADAILLEAGLSFLGLGVQPPTPSWGNILNVATDITVLRFQVWEWLPAGVAIVLTLLALNLVTDALRRQSSN